MIEKVDCLKLHYACNEARQELMLESKIQFTAQTPKNTSRTERAILVDFHAEGDDGRFMLDCVCRVIFSFPEGEPPIEGQMLLNRYQAEAYAAMQQRFNGAMTAIGQAPIDFPEISFQ